MTESAPDTNPRNRRKNFETLNRKCPQCGDHLIWNHTGIECGGCIDRNCTYSEGGEPYVGQDAPVIRHLQDMTDDPDGELDSWW
jgi:hypothetical protein